MEDKEYQQAENTEEQGQYKEKEPKELTTENKEQEKGDKEITNVTKGL